MADSAHDEVRIELGFDGSQGFTVTADAAQWEQLDAALQDGTDNWVQLHGKDDTLYKVNVAKVTFARVVTMSRSIGFSKS